MIERPVRIVLDTSAILAYVRGSIDVGETIGEVHDDGARIGLPVLSLVEGHKATVEKDWLDRLLDHHASAILGVPGSDWRALAVMYDSVEPMDAAATALAAIDLGCLLLTGRPDLYAGSAVADRIIALPAQ